MRRSPRRPRISTLALAGALSLAVLGTSVAAGLATGDQASATIAAPTLKPVPKVVKSTTGKKPPTNVRFKGTPVSGGITTGTSTATPAPGEIVIPGVPGYYWRDGCGPTAVGMVVGYYDLHGWDELIPGDATHDTAYVQQAIASHGTAEAPGHYDDYSLPQETTSTIVPDKSEAPVGDEHVGDSVADFMHTSWSADRLKYGYSYSNMVSPAFVDYIKAKYPESSPVVTTYGGTNLTWELVKREVDADRPMVFLVDCSGDGVTDHFITLVGYREVNGYAEYGFWDTWHTGVINWQRFRGVSSSYQWGVWGGYTFSMDASPAPDPTPTPTAEPTSEPTPSDTAAPITTAVGPDDAWHKTSVNVTFSSSDDASGVAYTEYRLDGYSWVRGTSVIVEAPKKTAVGIVHTLEYRSVDNAGNVEPAQFAQVKIDTVKPVTSSNADTKVHPGSFTLVLSAKDAHAGVAKTLVSLDGRAYTTGTSVVVTGAGRHTVRFYSLDNAGNVEGAKSVTVRIS
jgi:hypothetical protein